MKHTCFTVCPWACKADCIKYFADESATASGSAAAAEAASTPDDSFCQLFSANLSRDTQCLDDWRLQLLELLPAAGIQLTEAQVCKVLTNPYDASFPLAAFKKLSWAFYQAWCALRCNAEVLT